MSTPFSRAEKRFLETLESDSPELVTVVRSIRHAVQGVWDPQVRIIKDFTDHGLAHSLRILDYAERLLRANRGRPLSAAELFVLLTGAYLHDTGMQCDVPRLGGIEAYFDAHGISFQVPCAAPSANDYSVEEQKEIRRNHHLLSSAWLDYAYAIGQGEFARAIQSVPSSLVGEIGRVCKFHSKLPIDKCSRKFTYDNNERSLFVAAILRLADEMDIASNRVNIAVVENFRLGPANAVYWWLHNLTSVSLVQPNGIQVLVRLRSDDHEVLAKAVEEAFLKEFQKKNEPVLEALDAEELTLFYAKCGVLRDDHADRLPEPVVKVLAGWQQRGVSTTVCGANVRGEGLIRGDIDIIGLGHVCDVSFVVDSAAAVTMLFDGDFVELLDAAGITSPDGLGKDLVAHMAAHPDMFEEVSMRTPSGKIHAYRLRWAHLVLGGEDGDKKGRSFAPIYGGFSGEFIGGGSAHRSLLGWDILGEAKHVHFDNERQRVTVAF